MNDHRMKAAFALGQMQNLLEDYETEEDNDISVDPYDSATFHIDGEEWRILDDSEADEAVVQYVADSLWAFNTDFIARHCTVRLNDRAKEALQRMQAELCEDANPLIAAMIGAQSEDADDEAISEFAADAASADGRGHYLSHYDGEEVEFTDSDECTWYAYRLN